MTISEPWTFVTNLILTGVAFFYSWKIIKDPNAKNSRPYILWSPVFFFIALSALQGALFHGLAHELPTWLYRVFRVGTLWSLSATSAFLTLSLLHFVLRTESKYMQPLKILIFCKALFFVIFAVIETKFIVAITDYGSAFIFGIFVFAWHHKKSGAIGMLSGIVISIMAALVQALKIAPSDAFNHNDLYHVVQLIGLYVFYKNTPKLQNASYYPQKRSAT